jgi:uncharacterized protein YkwD
VRTKSANLEALLPNIARPPKPRPSRLLVVLAVAAFLAAAAVQSAAGAARITRIPTLEVQTLAAINELRREHGLLTLRASPALDSAAQSHSLSMAEHGYFTHRSAGGSAFGTRVGAFFREYRALGETMAWASPALTAQQTLQLWLRSPRHRQTLLSPTWREIGLGAVHAPAAPGVFGGLEVTILTADFGSAR